MDELMARLKAAEERAEIAEKQLQEEKERANKAEKQRQKEKERANKAEKQRQEEKERANKAEKQRQEEKERANKAEAEFYIKAKDAFIRPMPKCIIKIEPNSTTKGSCSMISPCYVREWEGFLDKMAAFYHSLDDYAKVRTFSYIFQDKIAQELGPETSIHAVVPPIMCGLVTYTFTELNIWKDKSKQFVIAGNSEGGRADVCLNVGQQLLALGEFKRSSVILSEGLEDKHPSVLYEDQVTNVKATLCQTYSYMISKGGVKYGFFTNYHHWCFMRRCKSTNDEEIVETTPFFKSSGIGEKFSAVLALATYLELVIGESEFTLPKGVSIPLEMGEVGENVEGDKKRSKNTPFNPTNTTISETSMTTTTALGADGVDSLTLLPGKNLISASEKAATYHGYVGDKHLVWRQIDMYGLPRNSHDFSLQTLEDMVTREIKAYQHLRPFWGSLLPHFYYFGQDFCMLWVFVISYEGISLSSLAKEKGGLDKDLKQKAREALILIHQHGVIHGDPVLRNVLYREADQQVLWIDFEFASILDDWTEEAFKRKSEEDLALFEKELASIPNLETNPKRPHASKEGEDDEIAPKKTKV